MEDRIRKLCQQILIAEDDAEFTKLMLDLRNTLHSHVEGMRTCVKNYPIVLERRKKEMLEKDPNLGGQ